ncbi:FUSC family protein [Streptomyces sp. NPDC057638]|uniref:FUSC family protein n=1 Tax=Streptomyces sp. NPDC057638 TaxID=3346190 RepID=UPI0036C00D5D
METQAGRLSPPEWLLSGLRPRSAPVPWAAAARAGVALSVPLAAGLAAGRPEYGALASMGAMSGVISDTADAYRMRIFHIAVPQLFGAIGVTVGTLVYGHGWVAVGVLTLVALVSGMISSIGAVASVSGLLLLLNAVVGAGLQMPEPWWLAPVLLTVGGLFVLLLSLLGWPLRGETPERDAVAATYQGVAELFAAAGTPGYEERRQEVTDSLNHAYDLILARRARDHGRRSPLVRLLAQLNVLMPLLEAAAAAHLYGRASRRAEIAETVRELARTITEGRDPEGRRTEERRTKGQHAEGQGTKARGRKARGTKARGTKEGARAQGEAPELTLPEPEGPADRAVDAALRHAATVVYATDPDPYQEGDRLGRPATLSVRFRATARGVLFSGASWRYGLRLALCIGMAQALVSLIEVERSYWVALTVTFVLKPDFGSVFSRAVLRALGTAAGLLVAAVLLAAVPRGWWDVPVMMLLAGLIPWFSAKGYAFQTAAITPVILLLSDTLNREGFGLVLPRLTDSLIGCVIALVVGYLIWPESWHSRIGDRLAAAVEETAGYVGCAFTTGDGRDRTEQVRRRRRIYRELSAVRSEFQRALTEPPPTGDRAAAWWPLVVAVERIVDAITGARVRVEHGATPPSGEEVAAVERQLRELAEGLRSSEVLVEVRAVLPGDEKGVLAPLRHEVTAARAIASPPRRERQRRSPAE